MAKARQGDARLTAELGAVVDHVGEDVAEHRRELLS
jgi:hypothetical protein